MPLHFCGALRRIRNGRGLRILQALFCCAANFFEKKSSALCGTGACGYKNTAFLWRKTDTPECVFIASHSILQEICKEAKTWQQAKKSE